MLTKGSIKLIEDTEREKEAIQLRERLEKGYRVHGWDKLEQPVSIVEP